MYTAELTFDCYRNTTLTQVDRAITTFIDALRNNGQILGREFPTSTGNGYFVTRVVCPEPNSVSETFHSDVVRRAIHSLHEAGLVKPKVKVTGQDLHSDHTDPCQQPSWQILYTTFLSTCSPLRCGEHFAPIPLYRLPEPIANGDHKQLLRWQQDWCGADELQMGGAIMEHAALHELGDITSNLFRRGYDLSKRIGYISNTPTYYYLYRVGGQGYEAECQRRCPQCNGDWKLEQPLFELFDFKCDQCQLLSNISWDYK